MQEISPGLMLWFVTRETWDYVVLESSVIPANLGNRFSVWTQFLTEKTGSMETLRGLENIDFVQWKMHLLLLFQILQSCRREVYACPISCSCIYDGNGLSELRFIHFSVCLCIDDTIYPFFWTNLFYKHCTNVCILAKVVYVFIITGRTEAS